MDTRNPTRHPCNFPDCADYDDFCAMGINMRCTRPVTMIEGEKLRIERMAAERPCPFTPWESFWIVALTLVAIAAVVAI
jgi:hypothetical protein